MKLTIKQTTAIYNDLADTPVKKFKDSKTAADRLNELLAEKGLVLRPEHDENCIKDYGDAFLFKRPELKIRTTVYKLPKAGTVTRGYWDVCTRLFAEHGRVPLFNEVMDELPGASINSVRTEYSRWCITHGITRKQRTDVRKSLS